MGKFEELLAQARSGDLAALDQLESEFAGSTLRTKAEEADKFKALADKALPLLRKNRVEELSQKLPENLREYASANDFADVDDPETITLESLQDKATSRFESETNRKVEAAREAGFDSVEDYQAALDSFKAGAEQRRKDIEAVGGGVASGSSDPSNIDEPTLAQVSKEAFEKARSDGVSTDYALAASIDALLTTQLGEQEE